MIAARQPAEAQGALLPRLRAALADLDPAQSSAVGLDRLVRQRLDQLPLPAAGATLQRWQALSAVAEHNLSLAKLYEGHTDALAVLAELAPDGRPPDGSIWGLWAAEAPAGRCTVEVAAGAPTRLYGAKCWCSGAAFVSHGLLTAWFADGRGPQLVSLAMDPASVSVSASAWQAVGMAGSASLDITLHAAPAECVGEPGAYLSRAGFWHGGAGIAACWYGGALALAHSLRHALQQAAPAQRSAFRLAALGKVDASLQASAAVLRDAAAWIDAHPRQDAAAVALRARLTVEDTAALVLDEAGRALGATPFCRDARFARAAADLPVFLRQSHAERDFAALGEHVLQPESSPWPL
jgi:hypothetical protein